jgi:endo-1,4-beta-xylanase
MKYLVLILTIITSITNLIANPIDTLVDLFRQNDKMFGSVANHLNVWRNDDSVYLDHLKRFDIINVGVYSYWHHTGPGTHNYTAHEAVAQFCIDNQIELQGIGLVGTKLPAWMDNLTQEEKLYYTKQHVQYTVDHFKDVMTSVYVVNHPWVYGDVALNELGSNYIDSILIWAHEANPKVSLMINESYTHGIDKNRRKAFEKACSTVVDLQSKNIPIHGLGFQMHTRTPKPFNKYFYQKFIDSLNTLGLEVQFSEVDVYIDTPTTEIKLELQATRYNQILDLCLSNSNATAFIVHGFTDAKSWIPKATNYVYGDACLLDSSYNTKLCYNELVKELKKSAKIKKQKSMLECIEDFLGYFGIDIDVLVEDWCR